MPPENTGLHCTTRQLHDDAPLHRRRAPRLHCGAVFPDTPLCTKRHGPGEIVTWALYPRGGPKARLASHAARFVTEFGARHGYVGKSCILDRPRIKDAPDSQASGDFCLHAPQTYNVSTWNRLCDHIAHFRLAIVVYVSQVEADALAMEEMLIAQLPAVTGIALSNRDKYHPGKLSEAAHAGYYVYLLLRF